MAVIAVAVASVLVAVLVLFLAYGAADISSGVYLKALCRVKTEERRVWLTFDDGPSAGETEKVLDVLKAHGAKATFFCTGRNLEENPGIAARIAREGHGIGNHSWSHAPSFPLYGLRRMKEDVLRCSVALEKATGYGAAVFRPPFGVTNPTVARMTRDLEYNVIGWSIRTYDTVRNPDKVLGAVKSGLRPGAVILLHDRLPQCAGTLESVLALLEREGYSFDRSIVVPDHVERKYVTGI